MAANPIVLRNERIDWPQELAQRMRAVPPTQLVRLSLAWSPTRRIQTAFYSDVIVDDPAVASVKWHAERLGVHVELRGDRVELTGPRSGVEGAQYVVTGTYGKYSTDVRSFNGGYIFGSPILTTFASR